MGRAHGTNQIEQIREPSVAMTVGDRYHCPPVARVIDVAQAEAGTTSRSGTRQRKLPTVANIKSQIKRNRQNEVRRVRNKGTRSELATRQKAAETAAGSDEGPAALDEAIRKIDKAASKGIIHKNKAARDKSRLIKRVSNADA